MFICCFCNKEIKEEPVTSLLVISNWDKEHAEQQEQQLFCHMECLKDKVSEDIPLYIADI